MRKRLGTGVLLLALLFTICACSASASPKDTVVKLEKAIHKMDMNDMLDCFDPTFTAGIKSIMKLTGSAFGIDGEAIFEMLPFMYDLAVLSGDESINQTTQQYQSISITVDGEPRYSYENTEAELDVIVSTPDGEYVSDTLTMKKIDGKWYIRVR